MMHASNVWCLRSQRFGKLGDGMDKLSSGSALGRCERCLYRHPAPRVRRPRTLDLPSRKIRPNFLITFSGQSVKCTKTMHSCQNFLGVAPQPSLTGGATPPVSSSTVVLRACGATDVRQSRENATDCPLLGKAPRPCLITCTNNV